MWKRLFAALSRVGSPGCCRRPWQNKKHRFTFDFSYNSFDPADPDYCSQEMVWEDIGVSCLTNVRFPHVCGLRGTHGTTFSGL